MKEGLAGGRERKGKGHRGKGLFNEGMDCLGKKKEEP